MEIFETLWTILLGLGLLATFVVLAGVALFVAVVFFFAVVSLALDVLWSVVKGTVRLKVGETKDRDRG